MPSPTAMAAQISFRNLSKGLQVWNSTSRPTTLSTAAQTVLSGLTKLEQRAGGDAFSCLLRCTGIILLADYAHSLCEEAGAESLAWCTALAGRVLVLAAAWPLLEEIGQKIGSIAG